MTSIIQWPRRTPSLASRDIETGVPATQQLPTTPDAVFGFPRVGTLEEIAAWLNSSIRPPRPLLLDLYCGAGGASMGYYRAGFDVIGIDVVPQPNYPFPFIQAEALSWLDLNWWMIRKDAFGHRLFDAVHASPPCQRWSRMSNCRKGLAAEYPDLIAPTRALLDDYAGDTPWVMENVPDAPLRDPIQLCGYSFGYDLYRHRLFESSHGLKTNPHLRHVKPGSRAGHWAPGTIISVSGHCAPMAEARKQMGGVDWMNRAELAESIPWYYTVFIGLQLTQQIQPRRMAQVV